MGSFPGGFSQDALLDGYVMSFEPTIRFYEEHHEIALGIKPKGRMEIYEGIYNFAGDKLPLWCHGVAR